MSAMYIIILYTDRFSKSAIKAKYSTSDADTSRKPRQSFKRVLPAYARGRRQAFKRSIFDQSFPKSTVNSPPSPLQTALDQLVKDCQIAMQNDILLEQENKKLCAGNATQRERRARKTRLIAQNHGLFVRKAPELKEARDSSLQAIPGPRVPPAQGTQALKTRRPPNVQIVGRSDIVVIHIRLDNNQCKVVLVDIYA